ncbi:CRP-like cAMP-binding protein [Methylobacterium sp. BE186]|uniref:Crp/Fnr family transcriptional regulator n=1 Tax=Methylobacterium sp. BE186 TaxID=2817715 RepID=UPI002861C62D|nr:Crp/Fnr family transcriptional regulator [Methylobacterium sp. BE186]MDR7039851.1 CRP-like cAMP-binding protein [Methylobacterium sp. BE186]
MSEFANGSPPLRPASNPLILKLERGAVLSDTDRATLEELCTRTRDVEARQDLIREGERPEVVHLVMSGLACRYKVLPDGKRQILAFLIPGDFCDLHVAILGLMDHSICTLSRCTMVAISSESIAELTLNHPRITRALWWATLVDEGILREWLTGMGQRSSEAQTAHLFCELLVRLQAVGLAAPNSCYLPLTQNELADALGISDVHMNRTLQQLRADGLIVLSKSILTVPDVARLQAFAHFNPNYLHLLRRSREA